MNFHEKSGGWSSKMNELLHLLYLNILISNDYLSIVVKVYKVSPNVPGDKIATIPRT